MDFTVALHTTAFMIETRNRDTGGLPTPDPKGESTNWPWKTLTRKGSKRNPLPRAEDLPVSGFEITSCQKIDKSDTKSAVLGRWVLRFMVNIKFVEKNIKSV